MGGDHLEPQFGSASLLSEAFLYTYIYICNIYIIRKGLLMRGDHLEP